MKLPRFRIGLRAKTFFGLIIPTSILFVLLNFATESYLTEKIRELAEAGNVSVVSRPQVAETLLGSTEVGEEIPRELYQQVAEIVGFIEGLHEQPESTIEGGGKR